MDQQIPIREFLKVSHEDGVMNNQILQEQQRLHMEDHPRFMAEHQGFMD